MADRMGVLGSIETNGSVLINLEHRKQLFGELLRDRNIEAIYGGREARFYWNSIETVR